MQKRRTACLLQRSLPVRTLQRSLLTRTLQRRLPAKTAQSREKKSRVIQFSMIPPGEMQILILQIQLYNLITWLRRKVKKRQFLILLRMLTWKIPGI